MLMVVISLKTHEMLSLVVYLWIIVVSSGSATFLTFCRATTILFVKLIGTTNSLSIACQNDINYIIFGSDSQSVLIGVDKDP
jgi:hypothetical protein